MKSASYAAGVTGVYRHYVDECINNREHYRVRREDIDYLNNLLTGRNDERILCTS